MIGSVARLVVRHRIVVVFFGLALVAVGVDAYRALPIDAVPDVTNVQVQVLTTAPGLAPEEMERLVTRPVELALSGLPHVSRVRSVSRAGISAVTIVFEDDVALERARTLVAERLPRARESVPTTAGRPELGPMTTGLGEVFHFTVRWPGHSARDVRTLVDWEIGPRLRSVPGVVEVNPWGGETRQVEVRLQTPSLLAHGLTGRDVEDTLLQAGSTGSAGSLERAEEATFVRADALYRTADDVARQVVATREGVPVTVGELAIVRDGSAPRLSAATADGEGETVYVMVQMLAGGNAHEVVGSVKTRLDEITRDLPEGVAVVPFYDRAAFVERVLDTVKRNLVEGGVVVALVLLLMLGDFAAGLLVASAIPLAMLGAFVLMRAFGVSGNLLSLGGIDFGLVVDGAVVVVEGALAAMAAEKLDGRAALARTLGEVGRPVGLGVLVIAIVYVPVLMLEGVEGRMFRPMALTVLFALLTALVLTFTWIPAVGSYVLRGGHAREPLVVRLARRAYLPLLARVAHRWKLSALAIALLAVSGAALATTLGAEFVPRLEEGDLAIQVTRPPSVSLAEATRGTTELEAVLRRFPEVRHVVSRTGSPDVATDVMGIEQSDVIVQLAPREEWTTARDAAGFAEAMEPVLRRALPGAALSFTQPIEMRMQELLGGVRSDVGVKVYGTDLPTLRALADRLARVVSGTQGAADVRVEPTRGLRMLTIRPDTRRMGRLGVRTGDVVGFVETLRAGRLVGRLVQDERRFDIVLRQDAPGPAADPEPIAALRIPLQRGRSVRLGDVADVRIEEGPAQVSREQGRRRILIEANVRGRDLASFVGALRARLEHVPRPPSTYYEIGGEYDNLARASARLAIVVPATLIAVLLLLYLAFGDLRPALIVLLDVPAAASGGVFALWLRDYDLSISAAVGFLALFGVATLNGIVLVAAARNEAARGVEALDAVREAASSRLRPVLTTALVAALGFVPMALSHGVGAEVQRPLATVVIGGLLTSTLVTLLALPALTARFGVR